MTPLHIFLADDHPIFRAGLRQILESQKEFKIIGEASNGEEALNQIRKNPPDIFILDVSMPVMNGIETARKCREEGFEFEILFLTMHQEKALIRTAADLRVRGYVLKESATEEIVEAVHAVAQHSEYISRSIAKLLLKPSSSQRFGKQTNQDLTSLTKAEIKILAIVSSDKTSKEIADELGLSVRTVENHRNRASKKLGLSGSHSLVKFAYKHREEIEALLD